MLIQERFKKASNNIEKTESTSTEKSLCNCRNKNLCPLKNKCLTKNLIYKATVTTKKEIKEYVGSTGGTCKTKWYGHIRGMKVHKENSTKLSKCIWKLKSQLFVN